MSMGFPRPEHRSGLPFSRGSSDPGVEFASVTSPALAGGIFTTWATWEAAIAVLESSKGIVDKLVILQAF